MNDWTTFRKTPPPTRNIYHLKWGVLPNIRIALLLGTPPVDGNLNDPTQWTWVYPLINKPLEEKIPSEGIMWADAFPAGSSVEENLAWLTQVRFSPNGL